VLFVLVAAAFAWMLRYTALGRYIYAVGGHEEAALLAGIPVRRVKLAAYVISSLFAAAAGVWLASRMSIGDPNVGTGLELDAITAALIGGSSLTGGLGTVPGTVAGVLVLAVLNNMMNLFGISPFAQQVVKGLIILAAVTVYRSRSR
jgi:ribose/xylose/arabinose/galactoside ABC-type transport system permease subunit